MIVALVVLAMCVHIDGVAENADQISWTFDAWEENGYGFFDPYNQYIGYGQYTDEELRKIRENREQYSNIWLCGTLKFPTEIVSELKSLIFDSYSLQLSGIIVSKELCYNEDDIIVEGNICSLRVNINMFVDERIMDSHTAVSLIRNKGNLSLTIVLNEKMNNTALSIVVSPDFEGMKERHILCDDLYVARIKSIEQIPQDASTAESRRWIDFVNPNGKTSWWVVEIEIMLPDDLKSQVKSVHIHSDLLDVFDTKREFLRLYGDAEYWCTVDDGVFQIDVLCYEPDATGEQIFQQLVDDKLRVWFSFEPIKIFSPWHPCYSYVY